MLLPPTVDRRSGRSADSARPVILIYCESITRGRGLLQELGAGMEEEGVPYRAEEVAAGTTVELAYAAAQASLLSVGVGLGAAGDLCVHHTKLPDDAPVLLDVAASARTMGHNAARLVTNSPLLLRNPDSGGR